MKYYLLSLWVIFHMLSASVAHSESVRWVTESWQNYTNKDGSGLYNDIVKAIFAEHQLDIVNMPWKRSLLEVKNGTADMTGATSLVEGYLSPHFPILATPISILFNKNNLIYTDISSLKEHTGVWASPYEDELFQEFEKAFFNGFSVQEREVAYKLLLSGRADYFIDAKAMHQAWLQAPTDKSKDLVNTFDYELKDISRLNLYMIFSNSARGQYLKEIFDDGMAKLIDNGQLRKIYAKYQLLEQMPMALNQYVTKDVK